MKILWHDEWCFNCFSLFDTASVVLKTMYIVVMYSCLGNFVFETCGYTFKNKNRVVFVYYLFYYKRTYLMAGFVNKLIN